LLVSNRLGGSDHLQRREPAASRLGVQLEILTATTTVKLKCFFELGSKGAEALLIRADMVFISRRVQLAILAVKHGVPVMSSFREQTDAGGLMSYGPSTADVNRQAGIYTGPILKGGKPADLPVMRASKFEFAISLQTLG
jgi:putative ABC transport system substrate-binding protein